MNVTGLETGATLQYSTNKNDTLNGNAGNDTLLGGEGNDSLLRCDLATRDWLGEIDPDVSAKA